MQIDSLQAEADLLLINLVHLCEILRSVLNELVLHNREIEIRGNRIMINRI